MKISNIPDIQSVISIWRAKVCKKFTSGIEQSFEAAWQLKMTEENFVKAVRNLYRLKEEREKNEV